MIWTIGKKVTATGIGVLLLSVGTASVGLMVNTRLGEALDRAAVSGDVLRNHMQADMMHDALRADVFAALLSADPKNGVALDDVRAALSEHRATFEKAIAENTALATDPAIKAALESVDAPLKTYVDAAGEVVDAAGRDPAQAQRMMPEFLTQFSTLETAMGDAADKIEAAALKNHDAAEATAVEGRLIMIGAVVLSLLISIGLILGGVRGLVAPIRRLTGGLRAMAEGKTEVHLGEARRKDEIGDIACAVVDIQALIVSRAQAEAAQAEQRRLREDEDRAAGDHARQAAAREQATVVTGLSQGLEALAGADLTYRIQDPFPQRL